jgi:hypothetical protein
VVCGGLAVVIGAQFEIGEPIIGAIALLIMYAFGGATIGSILGSWGLLRACAYPAAGRTARNMAVGWILSGALIVTTDFSGPNTLWILALLSVGVCCGARWIALASPAE